MARLGIDWGSRAVLRVGMVLAVFAVLLVPSARSSGQAGGAYIALGDSISAGYGATYMKGFVALHFGYLQSNGSGVTQVLNTGAPGVGTGDVIAAQLQRALGVINSSTPVKAVTLDIGVNEIPFDAPCADTSSAACPFAARLRTILERLNSALAARDPGVKIQVMQYFNSAVGTSREGETRTWLLGTDSKIDCAGTGAALGLNDLIHCVTLEEGALPVDVMPAFDAAGTAYIAGDGIHPNDAGHLAIAQAFGGAAAPTSPAPLPCIVPAVKGKQLAVARRAIVSAHCTVGNITRTKNHARKGTVLAQRPKAGTQLANGARVRVTVSRGRH